MSFTTQRIHLAALISLILASLIVACGDHPEIVAPLDAAIVDDSPDAATPLDDSEQPETSTPPD